MRGGERERRAWGVFGGDDGGQVGVVDVLSGGKVMTTGQMLSPRRFGSVKAAGKAANWTLTTTHL